MRDSPFHFRRSEIGLSRWPQAKWLDRMEVRKSEITNLLERWEPGGSAQAADYERLARNLVHRIELSKSSRLRKNVKNYDKK